MRAPLRSFVVVVCLALAIAPAANAVSYVIDGQIDDWNVQPQTYAWHYWWLSGRSFAPSSFTPTPQGTVQYAVEDYQPTSWTYSLMEQNDYEALYFDDSPEYLYVGVIASHPWNPAENTFRVTAAGVTVNAQGFDAFAWADLGIDEASGLYGYANYFYEGAISTARFGELPIGTDVHVYANCFCGCGFDDKIELCASRNQTNHVTPEPGSLFLLGLALAGLGFVRRRGVPSASNRGSC